MRQVSLASARAAVSRKRPAGQDDRGKGKQPKVGGPSVGAPSAAGRFGAPGPAASRPGASPQEAERSDEDVQIITPPSSEGGASPIWAMPVSAMPPAPRGQDGTRAGAGGSSASAQRGPSSSGAAPSSSSGPPPGRAHTGAVARSGAGTPSSSPSAGARQGSPGHHTTVTRRRAADGWDFDAHVGEGDSALHNASVARELSRVLLLPRDVKVVDSIAFLDIVNGVFPEIVKFTHDLTIVRNFVLKSLETMRRQEEVNRAAEKRVAAAERERDAAIQRETRLREETDSRMKEKNDALAKMRAQAARATADAEHQDAQLRVARAKTESAEGRAAAAEERARKAGDLAKAASIRADMAEVRAHQADVRARDAEKKASRVVEEYKDSDAFERDAAEACAGMYMMGFDDCKLAVVNSFPGLDLSGVSPPEALEGEEGEVAVATPVDVEAVAATEDVVAADAVLPEPAAEALVIVAEMAVEAPADEIATAPAELVSAAEVKAASGASSSTLGADPSAGTAAKE